MVAIGTLYPGRRFRLPCTNRTGKLLYANQWRARVRLDCAPVEFETRNGEHVALIRRRDVDWSPGTEVEPL